MDTYLHIYTRTRTRTRTHMQSNKYTPEQNQIHRLFGHIVEFDEERLYRISEMLHVSHFHIKPSISLRICKVTVN